MRARRLSTFVLGFMLMSAAELILHDSTAKAAPLPPDPTAMPVATATIQPVKTPCVPPPMTLALAFTSKIADPSGLDLRLPWGKPGDPEGVMVEDYGAYDGTSVREQLPVHDVTTGTMRLLLGHNAIDIVLDSGTPLYAVTSGTTYRIDNWTLPGGPRGYAVVVVSDTMRDDSGDPIAFLYGHVREFDTASSEHVAAGALIAKSGGGEDDPGRGFSDMPNVHFEVIEAADPLTAAAGTVNPHQFLENLYAHAAACVPH